MKSTEYLYDGLGAFGNPDGSREDFKRFVELRLGGLAQVNPSHIENCIRIRVIVGAKGSGKTLYMRKMIAEASENESIAVIKLKNQLPSTDLLLSIHKLYDDKIRTEQWSLLWRRSIFLSVASQFYCANTMHPKISTIPKMGREEFFKEFKSLITSKFITPMSIFSQLTSIIHGFGTDYKKLAQYLESPEWDSFETILAEVISNSPPLVYFIDAIDEELRHAPAAWLDIQKGLFYQVMRLLRDSEFGGKLHIIICIRDLVYSSILQSEHAGRYIKDEHIKILHWSRKNATEFFRLKIQQLDNKYFIDKNGDKTLYNLVGTKEIRNTDRGITEDIESYILRHTRYFPRDLINIGNSLCTEIGLIDNTHNGISEAKIKKSVSDISSVIARETLAVCGNNLAVSSLPKTAIRSHILEQFTENPFLSDAMNEIVYQFITEIGKDHFNYDELYAAINKFQKPFEEFAEKNKYQQYRLDTVLWQHCLLGYKNKIKDRLSIFKNSSPTEPFTLPVGKPVYVLHSCLIDILPIKFKRGIPVLCD